MTVAILKCLPFKCKGTEEMVKNVKKNISIWKFPIQLESTFGNSNILVAYVSYLSQTQNQIIDEILFANYLRCSAEGVMIFKYMEEYFNK